MKIQIDTLINTLKEYQPDDKNRQNFDLKIVILGLSIPPSGWGGRWLSIFWMYSSAVP